MSVFDTPNPDGYHGVADEASAGPRLGFQDALMASWNMQTKVNSLFAIEKAFGDVEQAQIAKMSAAGLRPHRPLVEPSDDGFAYALNADGRIANPYMDAARSIAGTGEVDVDGQGGGAMAESLKERNAHILREREAHPELGLKTYEEMFAEIQAAAQDARKRDDLPKTIGGHIGALLGGAAGGLNPTTDPLNAITLPLGFGKTIAQRLAVQSGLQGLVEGADIGLAGDTHKLLFGTDATATENALRIGGAAAGGFIAQGLGEAAVAGTRRLFTGKWFHDAPLPPELPPKKAPEPTIGDLPPPVPRDAPITDFPTWDHFVETHGEAMKVERLYGTSREATAREAQDVAYIGQQLDRWDGPNPSDIPARTFSASIPDVEPGVRYSKPYTNYIDRMETVDDIARRLDPDLFRLYDLHASHRAEGRDKILELEKLPASADRDNAIETTRRAVVAADERMRGMSPLVSRVYGAADHEWRHTPVDFATLDFLKRLENDTGWRYRGDGKPSLTEAPLKTEAAKIPPNARINDTVPLARLSPEMEAKIGPASDATDRVAANVTENQRVLDEKVTQFVGAAKQATSLDGNELRTAKAAAQTKLDKTTAKATEATTPEEKTAAADAIKEAQAEFDALHYVTFPDGSRLHMDNDRIAGPDGNDMIVRDFLREMDKDQEALKSVMTCSRPS